MIRLDDESACARPAGSADAGIETLLTAVEALLRARRPNAPLDHDDLAFAAGVAWLFTWPTADDACPSACLAGGREVALAASADLLGLVLRPLHPPASDGGASCGRFPNHFRDSYAPLMAAALEHGQPMLCCGGWGGRWPTWGLLTRCEPSAARFGGFEGGAAGEPAWLATPPAQVYVVEAVGPDSPGGGRMLVEGLRLARGWPTDPRLAAVGLAAGSGAIDCWASRLERARPFCRLCAAESWQCAGLLAERLRAGRISAYEFLCRHGEDAPRAAQVAAMRLEPLLAEQIERAGELADLRDPADAAAVVRKLADIEREIELARADV